MAWNQATMQYLDARGLVRLSETDGKERVNREEIVARFGTTLKAGACDDLARIEDESKSVAEWREEILGDGNDDPLIVHDLNLLAGQLLAISATGPVQQYLEDGVVLCKTTIRRADDNGVIHVKKGRGRIVSSDPDVIERYHDAIKSAELIRKGQSTRASLGMSARRVPELANRQQQMRLRTTDEIAQLLLMPAPADEAESDDGQDPSEGES